MEPDQLPGAPTQDEATPPAPAEQAVAPETPQLPFSLEDVNDEFTLTGDQARQWLTTRQAQLQAPLTRRSQELAVEREQVAALAELQARLDADDTKTSALQELALRAGIELDFGDEEPPPEQVYEDPLEAEVAELRKWRAEQDGKAVEAEQATHRQSAELRFNEHAVSEMQRLAEGLGQSLDEMPAHVKQDIVARALTAPKRPDGLPDFDAGFAAHLEYVELVAAASREKYATSKSNPNPGISGGSGVAVTDLRNTQSRIAAALTAADRHYVKQ